MDRIALTALLKIELPTHTIRLTDGGFKFFAAEIYRSSDPVFGTIGSVDALEEGFGDEIPAMDLEMLPPGTTAAGALSRPGFQQSRVRFWIAEYNVASGQIVGMPDLMFDGQVDQTTIRRGAERRVSIAIVGNTEKLFELDIGNTLSPSFHKSVWPGELGHDNATSMKIKTAWGVEGPSRSYGGGSGGGSRGVQMLRDMRLI